MGAILALETGTFPEIHNKELRSKIYDLKVRYQDQSNSGTIAETTFIKDSDIEYDLERIKKISPKSGIHERLKCIAFERGKNLNKGVLIRSLDKSEVVGHKITYPTFERVPVSIERVHKYDIEKIRMFFRNINGYIILKRTEDSRSRWETDSNNNPLVFSTLKEVDKYLKTHIGRVDYFVVKTDLSKVFDIKYKTEYKQGDISSASYCKLRDKGALVEKLYNGIAYGRMPW